MKIPDGFTLNSDEEYMAFMAKLNATLKPCPCGNPKPGVYWYGDHGVVVCNKCYKIGPRIEHTEDTETENIRALVKAVEAWNKRAAEEDLCRR